MKNLLLFFALIMMLSCGNEPSLKNTAVKIDTTGVVKGSTASIKDTVVAKLYQGAWFDIKYPADFSVKPSLISATNKEAYESAFFTSPAGDVSFYVFSPQWSGKATDIALKPSEKIVSRDSVLNAKNKPTLRNWTIEANDKSYKRSYQEIIKGENINWVFGIKYKNDEAYNKYKDRYLAFKKSIVQYAD